ncbi:hypothetical protein D3C77_547000 [compost metagenome]
MHADGHHRVEVGEHQQDAAGHTQCQALLHGQRGVPVQHATTALAHGALVLEQRRTLVNRVAVFADDQVIGLVHGASTGSPFQGRDAKENNV